MLSLDRRNCRIGNAINTRAETHGDEPVTALDIPLADIMLNEAELNAILQDPKAHSMLFTPAANGHLTEPRFEILEPLQLSEKVEGARVTIFVMSGKFDVVLSDAKLKAVKLEPQVGGLTSMSCKVQCQPTLDIRVARMLEALNHEAEVEITAEGYGDQAALPLNKAGEEEQEKPGRRRNAESEQPRAH